MQQLPVTHVFRREDGRKVDPAAVKGLVESIREVGIINPLRVRPVRRHVDGVPADAWEVTAGGHRLAAARKLGMVTVPCIVVEDDDLHAELAMIDENLCRADLTPAERAKQTARRKEIYEKLHPETRNGATGGGHDQLRKFDEAAPRFTADAAEKTGRSESSVQKDAARGKDIAPDVLDRIKGTRLDTGVYLDALRKLPHEEQRARVERALAVDSKKQAEDRKASRIDSDVKARAAKEVAEIIAEHVPGDAWDAIKANLYAAGAKNIADALTNITGQSIMDRRYGS